MKKVLKLMLAMAVAMITLTACDKIDDNGDFGGYWILETLENLEGEDITPTTSHLAWAIHKELLEMRDLNEGKTSYFFTFSRSEKTLQLTSSFFNDGSNDTKVENTDIPEFFRVPADGHYDILYLSNSKLILKTNTLTYTFRKY